MSEIDRTPNEHAAAGSEEDITALILSTLEELRTDGGYCLKISMDLPPMSRVENEKLLDGIDAILRQYNIEIPPDIRKELQTKTQCEVVFLAPSLHDGLRPRTVAINTNAEVRSLFIRGEAPIDGKDSRIEVHFDYSEKPGRLLPDGTIDFRNINKFPQAKEGQILLSVYEPTQGTPGTDVEGGRIPPKTGNEYSVDAGEGIKTEKRYDDEEKRYFTAYIAERPGIVICTFEGGVHDAEHLRQIEIRNKITVKNIDFSTGNIGDTAEEVRCVADVTVEGDIKGSFAVIIDGNLEVKGAVEGEKVDVSGDFRASFVRSSVKTGKKAKIGSAWNARIFSEELVLIEREAARCMIDCPVLVLQPRGTPTVLVGQLDASVTALHARGCEIRGRLNVVLGQSLLRQLDEIEARRQTISKKLDVLGGKIKDNAMIFLQKIKSIKSSHRDRPDEELDFLQALGTSLLKGNAGAGETMERLKKWGETRNPANAAIARALKSLAHVKEDEEKLLAELNAIDLQEQGINEQLSRMEVSIDSVLKGSGTLVVVCGKEKKKWQADPSGEQTPVRLTVQYVVGKGLTVSEV